ncbi:MAG: hypothetical protein PHE89_00480 [Alphaproteobacteria bacterium]|nr:hypothetical protein [Alphaproteobacteria bacterium]
MKTFIIVVFIVAVVVIFFFVYLLPIIIKKIYTSSPKQTRIDNLYHHFKENPSAATDDELKELKEYFSSHVPYVPVLGNSLTSPKYSKTMAGYYLDEVNEEIKKREEK